MNTRRNNIPEIFGRHRRDPEAALTFIRHQTFAAQQHQGFTDRTHAEAIAVLKSLQTELRIGFQHARQDIPVQQPVCLIGKRAFALLLNTWSARIT